MGLMERNRLAFNADTRGTDRRKYFSPTIYAQFETALPIARKHAHGDLLDIGAGDVPYRDLLRDRVQSYRTVDFSQHVDEIDFVADAGDMRDVIASDSFDTAILFEVLEHVQDPFKVAGETYRILRSGGAVIASVPHLSRVHEAPNDYYRYTSFGLRHIFESVGFTKVAVTPRGGLFSFLGHQASTALVCSTWHLPVLREVAFAINKWAIVRPAVWLDRISDRSKLFANGYVLVAYKQPALN